MHPLRLSGISKQAFYKRLRTQQKKEIEHQKMIKMVKDYRKKVGSKTGGIKLYAELKVNFNEANIKIGRDKFYRLLRLNNLLIPKTKNYITTTNSNHMYKKYKNLVKDHVPTRPEQLWVRDITYIKSNSFRENLVFC